MDLLQQLARAYEEAAGVCHAAGSLDLAAVYPRAGTVEIGYDETIQPAAMDEVVEIAIPVEAEAVPAAHRSKS